MVLPGPDFFLPAVAQAGAIGDADYSPLVTPDGRTVLNASQVANASGQHDAIVDIDFARRRVTLDTLSGFYEGKQVHYLHQEASAEVVAALEGSTLAPNLDAAPGLGWTTISPGQHGVQCNFDGVRFGTVQSANEVPVGVSARADHGQLLGHHTGPGADLTRTQDHC